MHCTHFCTSYLCKKNYHSKSLLIKQPFPVFTNSLKLNKTLYTLFAKHKNNVPNLFPDEFRSKVGCENDVLHLSCNPHSRVAIYSAQYGRTEYSIQCPQPRGIKEESKYFYILNIFSSAILSSEVSYGIFHSVFELRSFIVLVRLLVVCKQSFAVSCRRNFTIPMNLFSYICFNMSYKDVDVECIKDNTFI